MNEMCSRAFWLLLGVDDTVDVKQWETKRTKEQEKKNNENNRSLPVNINRANLTYQEFAVICQGK